nr:hypothetical protein HmN_000079300 [Hymenolepis microstoma]
MSQSKQPDESLHHKSVRNKRESNPLKADIIDLSSVIDAERLKELLAIAGDTNSELGEKHHPSTADPKYLDPRQMEFKTKNSTAVSYLKKGSEGEGWDSEILIAVITSLGDLIIPPTQ